MSAPFSDVQLHLGILFSRTSIAHNSPEKYYWNFATITINAISCQQTKSDYSKHHNTTALRHYSTTALRHYGNTAKNCKNCGDPSPICDIIFEWPLIAQPEPRAHSEITQRTLRENSQSTLM